MLFRIKEETIDEQFRPIGYCFHKRDAMDVPLVFSLRDKPS